LSGGNSPGAIVRGEGCPRSLSKTIRRTSLRMVPSKQEFANRANGSSSAFALILYRAFLSVFCGLSRHRPGNSDFGLCAATLGANWVYWPCGSDFCQAQRRNPSQATQIESPARQLYVHFLTKYMLTGKSSPDTTVHKIIQAGFSPTLALLKDTEMDLCPIEDGVVDSIKYLLFSQGFQKLNNLEHRMVNLLTKS
jgi:hypothetical protein